MWKRGPAFLAALVLLTLSVSANAITLESGSRGEDVLKLKERMYELGYYRTNDFNDIYNNIAVERVKQLQKKNKLKQTGVVTDELWELIFSDACVAADGTVKNPQARPGEAAPASTPGPEVTAPAVTPKPDMAPAEARAPLEVPGAPERDAEGFLTTEPEFSVSDFDVGFWAYLSDTLQVVIHRYWDEEQKVCWFACDIRTRGDERIQSLSTGGKYVYPRVLARSSRSVLAFTDDNHDYRINQKETVGIVIRNGKILSTKQKKPTSGRFPKLEMLACFADGSMKCYNSLDHTADELLEMGAENVLAFGPILVTDGHLGEHMRETEAEAKKENYYHYHEPRLALGMVAPGHYIVINVTGRYYDKRAAVPGMAVKGSKNGVYLDWVALKMLELGATEAINLDGGWTTSLCFLGESLNMKYTSSRKTRYMMAFGVSELASKD